MKKILYLSFYFEPDLCAGSFRNTPLVHELSRQLNGKGIIDVITTLPNRYNSFSVQAPMYQQQDNLTIHRIKLPLHKSGIIDQIKAFFVYYKRVKETINHKEYDLVVASSSRFFTAFLGYRIASKNSIPLYLDVRDILIDTLQDVISSSMIKFFLLPVLRLLEFKVFNYAIHINLISDGFRDYFSKYTNPSYTYFTNGIDPEFIHEFTFEESLKSSPITVTYAGNIGAGQGLHKIIPQAAKLLGEMYQFRVIGDGGSKKKLEDLITQENIKNVSIEKPVKRNELVEIFKQSHYLLMHLNDYSAFEKVLPSKVFELGAFPRPILAGVNGYARSFIEKNICNVILFEPANPNDLVEKILLYSFQIESRKTFIQSFSRTKINKEMAANICTYV